MVEQLRLLEDQGALVAAHDEPDHLVIRESVRARRLILQLLPPYTFELVVPRGTRPGEVEAFLSQHQGWIERTRTEMRSRYPRSSQGLPRSIALRAIDQTWPVDYVYQAGARPRRRVFEDRLELTSADPTHEPARRLLRTWLLEQARAHLKPWLAREARNMDVVPQKIQVRTQRTRWGSCSGLGNISLNAGLLFLESPLVRYLLIHELSHLRYLNHSGRFWRLVGQFEHDYRALDRRLTESWSEVPLWALSS